MINRRTELAASAWEVTPWPRPAVAFRGLYVDLEEPLATRLTAQTTSGHRAQQEQQRGVNRRRRGLVRRHLARIRTLRCSSAVTTKINGGGP